MNRPWQKFEYAQALEDALIEWLGSYHAAEIKEAVNTAHLHNVKVYVTVNTLIKEDELKDVLDYLNKLYAIGVDAVLVQDLGVIELINKYIPNLKIHASTQLTCENQRKIN